MRRTANPIYGGANPSLTSDEQTSWNMMTCPLIPRDRESFTIRQEHFTRQRDGSTEEFDSIDVKERYINPDIAIREFYSEDVIRLYSLSESNDIWYNEYTIMYAGYEFPIVLINNSNTSSQDEKILEYIFSSPEYYYDIYRISMTGYKVCISVYTDYITEEDIKINNKWYKIAEVDTSIIDEM